MGEKNLDVRYISVVGDRIWSRDLGMKGVGDIREITGEILEM